MRSHKHYDRELAKFAIVLQQQNFPEAGEAFTEWASGDAWLPADCKGFAYKRMGKRAEAAKLYWCGDCGESFSLNDVTTTHIPSRKTGEYSRTWAKDVCICPHCGRPLELHGERRAQKLTDYVSFHAHMGDWDIERIYSRNQFSKVGSPAKVHLCEVAQEWDNGSDHFIYAGQLHGMFYASKWIDGLKFGGKFRESNPISSSLYYSDWSVMPNYTETYEYKDTLEQAVADFNKYGITPKRLASGNAISLLATIQSNPRLETLWKADQRKLFNRFKEYGNIEQYWPSIKICLRNGYMVEDCDLWCDMIDAERALGLDLRNAVYVCPSDLKGQHDRMADRRERMTEKQELAALSEKNKAYKERIAQYMGMTISNGSYTIVVLPDIASFKHEGDILHHCVYKMKYYDKAESLCLSARDKEGNSIETIEVDLNKFTVRQCYGDHDSYTPHHKEIMHLMNENMWQIIKAHGRASRAVRMAS